MVALAIHIPYCFEDEVLQPSCWKNGILINVTTVITKRGLLVKHKIAATELFNRLFGQFNDQRNWTYLCGCHEANIPEIMPLNTEYVSDSELCMYHVIEIG